MNSLVIFFVVVIIALVIQYAGGIAFHLPVRSQWAIQWASFSGAVGVILFWLFKSYESYINKAWEKLAAYSFFPLWIIIGQIEANLFNPTHQFWPIFFHSLLLVISTEIIIFILPVFILPFKLPFLPILTRHKKSSGFLLWGGLTTGLLLKRGHVAGSKAKKDIYLKLTDAYQNIIALGGIGSGKTTCIMNPMLLQLLRQDCGGLIFDVKGDFKKAVYTLANQNKREIVTVGIGQRGLNLLKGLTPEMASSFLKSAFYLTGKHSEDGFWIDTATELCKNSLGVLSFIPDSYSLESLYRYIFFENDRWQFTEKANNLIKNLNQRQTKLLISYMNYIDSIFANFDIKVKQGTLATVSQVISPFQHPDLIDTFCIDIPEAVNMEDVLNGTIFLVDLPLSSWGLAAKTVYTLIKLRFFNVLQSRPARPEINQERPIFFICDEYQDVISANKDGLSDLNFWDKSRSAKCIGIISSQSISSFRAALADKTLADAILQNFRQKFCFRTEDIPTLDMLNQIAGRTEVQRVSENEHSGTSYAAFEFTHYSQSSGTSVGWTERPVVDGEVIRGLGPNQAVAFLNINGLALDDVVNLYPLFID